MMLHCLLTPSLPETHSNKPKKNNLLAQQEKPELKKFHLPLKFDQFGSGQRYHNITLILIRKLQCCSGCQQCWRPETGTFWRDNIEEIVNSASCVLVFAAKDKDKQKKEKNERYTSSTSGERERIKKKVTKPYNVHTFPGGIPFFCAHISRYSCSAVPGVNNWGWRPQTGTFWRDNIEGIVNSASCVLVFAANDKGPFLLFLSGDIISPLFLFAVGFGAGGIRWSFFHWGFMSPSGVIHIPVALWGFFFSFVVSF
ncbi:hypothetical protein CDAR_105501 [Caerostris darwini]|uniref:Uncharacterized protein n=1 Tax=Caerostris darwini TaxID=1538125 RepID=A0AAV4MY41_9ARAC|nr:hypothetical protein CDAR_105501 [Caerostris darwini]